MPDLNKRIRDWSLHRQLLAGKKPASPTAVLKSVIAVYSAHPTAALSLAARTATLTTEKFHQLDNKVLALRMPAMRLSIFLLPRTTAWRVFSATIPPADDPIWDKRYSQKDRAVPPDHYKSWSDDIVRITGEPRAAADIRDRTDIPISVIKPMLNRLAFEGRLLRVGAESLSSNLIKYVDTAKHTGKIPKRDDPDKALAWLAGEYLRAFGPARVKDFAWWAGVNLEQAGQAFEKQKTTAVSDDLVLLAKDEPAFGSKSARRKDSLVLLPKWDSYTMGYAPDGRSRFVDDKHLEHLYGRIGATGGNALNAILVNGLFYGRWDMTVRGGKLSVTLRTIEPLTAKMQKDIDRKIDEIAALFGADKKEFAKKQLA